MARRGRRYVSQAALEARARFGPQERALAQLLLETQAQAKGTIKGIRGVAVVNQRALQAARPEITGAYQTAGQVRGAAYQDISPFLDQMDGPVAGLIRAGVGREAALGASHLAASRASNLSELALRKTAAAAGALGAIRETNRQAHDDVLKIGQQIAGLQGDKGAFLASTINSLRDADRKFGLQSREAKRLERASVASITGVDPVTGQLTPAGRKAIGQSTGTDPVTGKPYGGKKPGQGKKKTNRITGDQQGQAVDQIRIAVNAIRQFGGKGGIPSTDLRRMLESGYKSKGGTTIPKIAHAGPIAAHDLINAAFDIATFHTLSPTNRRALRGVHVPAPWKRPMPRRRPRVGSGVGGAIRF